MLLLFPLPLLSLLMSCEVIFDVIFFLNLGTSLAQFKTSDVARILNLSSRHKSVLKNLVVYTDRTVTPGQLSSRQLWPLAVVTWAVV